jgi:hypothetical protein
VNFFASANQKQPKTTRLANTKGEERAMDEDESQENLQAETDTDETRRQTDHSQTPPLRSQTGSDTDDDQEEDREEQTTGGLWGHGRLSQSVYDNNPPTGGKRVSKQNAVKEVVKHLKKDFGRYLR